MKRLNPHTLEISYLDEKLDLHACHSEIVLVRKQLKPAYNKVRSFQPLLGAAR